MSRQQQMIDVQADIISKNNETIRHLKERNARLEVEIESLRPAATLYFQMQEAILNNEGLQDSWDQFLVLLRLCLEENDPLVRKDNDQAI